MKKRTARKPKKKHNISSKEKKELALVLGSVFIVALIGIIITFKSAQVSGMAVSLDPKVPTFPGTASLLHTGEGAFCNPVQGDGSSCNDVCGTDVCVPVDSNCDQPADVCLCCKVPG